MADSPAPAGPGTPAPTSWSYLLRAVRFVWQAASGWAVANALFTPVQGAFSLLQLYMMKLMVDAVAAGVTAHDKGPALHQALLVIGVTAGVAALSALCNTVAGYATQVQSQQFTDHMQAVVHAKCLDVDLEYYENARYHDSLHRAQGEATSRPLRIVGDLVGLVQSTVTGAAVLGLLIRLHWSIPGVLLLTSIPAVWVRLRYARHNYDWQRRRTPEQRRTSYFNWVLTGDPYAKEVRLFDLGTHFRERYRELRTVLRGEQLGLSRRQAAANLGANLVGIAAAFAALAFMAYRAISGGITLGDLVMYRQAFQRGQGYVAGILKGLAGFSEHRLFLGNLFEFLDLPKRVDEPASPVPVPRPMRSGVAFREVSFHYPTGRRTVLDGVSLSVAPGEVVALVGPNGAGKTTLIKLLWRLYDPTEGQVTLDGTDLRDFSTVDLRREIAVIFQDYAHYPLTVRENIRVGQIGLPEDDVRVVEAAQRTGADGFVSELPNGYGTMLGKWFADGEELSIGEWQKLALARAFVRDAQLIVLDEPTSSMDAQAEQEVFEAFREVMEGRSAIIISHRFSTVRMADRIYVLEDGRITGSGTHADLVARGDAYAHLYEAQAQHYR
jgi:ATP-binding cassette subfamily B protein